MIITTRWWGGAKIFSVRVGWNFDVPVCVCGHVCSRTSRSTFDDEFLLKILSLYHIREVALCIRRTRTRVMLHVFLVMLHTFRHTSCNVARVSCNVAGVSCNVARVSCNVAGVSLHETPAAVQETRATLHETRVTLHETRATLQETRATLKHVQHYTKHVQHYTNTCNITRNMCNITWNTCNITRNTSNFTRNTCNITRVRRPRPRPPNTQSPESQAKTRLVNGPENDCEPGPESVQPNSAEAKKLLRGHEAQNPQRPRPRPVYLLVYSVYSVQRQLTTTQAI